MDLYASLFEISKLLLAEEDDGKRAEILARRVIEATGAERGFLVVREGDRYEEKFQVRFDRSRLPLAHREFSRGLVRRAIETRELIYSSNLATDPRFASRESAGRIGPCCVLVAPLQHAGEVYGVIYLENRGRLDSFAEDARRFLGEFAEVAGLFIKHALEREELRRRNRSLERDLLARHDFAGIVTRDPGMLGLLKTVAQVADSDATVLIQGETGTGKELIAQALHLNSRRKHRPFVTLNCAALPGTLLESELFGHVKGAFTGAQRDRPGRIASAAGGTLCLDEVAEIPPDLQAKLLRFLERGEIQRVGSDRTERLDVRVLAASHQDLRGQAEAGRFRPDLYYRLCVVELRVPPLKDRRGDVPLLLDHFLRKHWKRPGERPRWTGRARRALEAYGYPGNVRELMHLVERACLLATGPQMDVDLLPPELSGGRPVSGLAAAGLDHDELQAARESAVREVERAFLDALMKRWGGNVSQAARESGLRRSYLQRLLARHRADPPRA